MKRRSFLFSLGGTTAVTLAGTPLIAGVSSLSGPAGQPESAPGRPGCFGDGRDWFLEKRFGMFAHWGLYSIPAWHEQHQWRARVPRAEYVKLAQQWNPEKFNPEQWLDLLEEAGMRYLTLTTKHHDGFCLFDSAYTRFTSVHTPYKRDIVAMVADACHRRKLPLCLYYSIADWNHPNYPNQGRHHELPAPEPGDKPDWDAYLEFLKKQVSELCSNYGAIHGFWWDMNVSGYKDPSINAMIRKLQPQAVINDRGFDAGDFGTPERDYDPDDARAIHRPVEACQAVGSESWGFRKDEDYYSVGHLQRSIARYLARGCNYVLNVGPQSDGTIDSRSSGILRKVGSWLKEVGGAFGDSIPASHLTTNRDVMLTRRGKTIHVILTNVPTTDAVKLKPITTAPKSAILLNPRTTLETSTALCPSDFADGKGYLRIRGIPADNLASTAGVIQLDFDELPPEVSARETHPAVR